VLTNPQAHPTQGQLKSVKTSKARQKIHSWLVENDPTFIDREAQEKREAEIAANTIYSKKIAEENLAERKRKAEQKKIRAQKFTGQIKIDGDTRFQISMAQCCKAVPGDPIVGYVSRNRGITVHRADCRTFLRIPEIEKRSVKVEWDVATEKKNDRREKLNEQRRERARQKQLEKNQYKKQR
jgi:GTP pyrophosphokinase